MLFIFLAAVTPFWMLDLGMRAMDVVPPAWLGDAMALSLMLAAICLARRAWMERRAQARPAAAQAWEDSLPCLVHEIRNYSSIIKGNAQLLRSRMGEGQELEPLCRLERTTDKIETLAQEILDSSNLSRVDCTEPVCLQALLETCVAEHFHDTRGSFRLDAEGALPAIAGDSRKLERVFLNLFRNAREAGANAIHIRLVPAPGRLRVLVEDDGQGCAPDATDKIFRPLYSTKKETGGTGLGLYMVKSIMEAHGGLIRAVSKNAWGGGRTGMIFCLEFPASKETETMHQTIASNRRAIPMEGVAG